MVTYKRKKVTKYRAHTTHGGGSRKKRRGAGSRGGRGNAGTGKRAGHRKAGGRVIAGKGGFTPRRTPKTQLGVNVSHFTFVKLDALVAAGKITKEGDVYTVDLAALGFDKLLGTGSISAKVNFTASKASPKASEKVQAAGGSVSIQEA